MLLEVTVGSELGLPIEKLLGNCDNSFVGICEGARLSITEGLLLGALLLEVVLPTKGAPVGSSDNIFDGKCDGTNPSIKLGSCEGNLVCSLDGSELGLSVVILPLSVVGT